MCSCLRVVLLEFDFFGSLDKFLLYGNDFKCTYAVLYTHISYVMAYTYMINKINEIHNDLMMEWAINI